LKKIIFLILIAFTINAFADLKENEILKRRATQYKSRKQYERAITLYESIEKNDPEDMNNIGELILTLIQTSKIQKAEGLLTKYGKKLQEDIHFQFRLMLLLHEAEIDKAQRLSNKFLDKQKGRLKNYGITAKIYEQYRQYEDAVKIYLKARKIAGDEYLFVQELAYNYQALKENENAVKELLKLIENGNQLSSFVLSRLKPMLKEDPSVIRFVGKNKKEDPAIRDIYALCLGEIGEYEKALKEYEYLPEENLLKFAQRMEKSGQLEIAVRAYNVYLFKSNDINKKAKTQIKLTNIYINQNELTKAEEILLMLYQDDELQKKKNRYKSRANKQCRELLAQIYLMRNAPQKEVIKYLEEAKEYTFNKNDLNEIEYKIIHLLIMDEKNDLAKETLSNVLIDENSGSETFKKGYYYSFLLALMTNDVESDSLLGELLINIPEDAVTNDALLLFQRTGQFSNDSDRKDFLDAFRKRSLYQNSQAIELLRSIYSRSGMEEILFLAAEWAMQTGEYLLATELFAHEYSDSELQQYADLKLVEMEKEHSAQVKESRDFLQTNPLSVFSPQFRRIMGN